MRLRALSFASRRRLCLVQASSARLRVDIAVASSARRQGQGCDEGDGWVVFGPEKVELDLRFVRVRRNQDDFVLVNRAASRLCVAPLAAQKQAMRSPGARCYQPRVARTRRSGMLVPLA